MTLKRIKSVFILFSVTAFGQGPQTFVAVHLEPTHTGYYQSLVDLVALADSFHASLTLEFNPQWADTILAAPALLLQVRGWQRNGHEIAAHHHAVSYGANGWDGYTNRPAAEYPAPFKYRGNMQDYFILLSSLAGDSLLLTGCITDAEVEWPPGLIYRTDDHNAADCLSRPSAMTLNGQAVTSLGFGLINTRQRVDSVQVFYNSAGPKDVIGVVLHEKDFADNPMNLRSWLQFLKDKGKTVKTVRRILRDFENATGIAGSRETGSTGPIKAELLPAYPNPFNASTTVHFTLAEAGSVRLDLADTRGRIVLSLLSQNMEPGVHAVRFDAGGLPSGVYFFVLKAEGLKRFRKILLMR